MANRTVLIAAALLLAACSKSIAPTQVPVAGLKAIADDWWQWHLREAPVEATELGEYQYNDQLGDNALAHTEQVRQKASEFLARLEGLDAKTLSDADQLDQTILEHELSIQIEAIDLKNYEMPVDQLNGIHLSLPEIADVAPFDTVKHFDDYIARLKQVPAALRNATAAMRQGMADGLTPPRVELEQTVGQCHKIGDPAGEANPFASPIKKIPPTFSADDRKRLHDDIVAAVDGQVRPAYRAFADFIAKEYAPQGRKDPGIWALPDGDKRYLFAVKTNATALKTPEQIHQLGLAQVAAIEKEIDALAKSDGYPDGKTYRAVALKDPKNRAKSREQILENYRRYLAQMEPKLPQLFGRLPKAKLTVTSVPEYEEKEGTTRYIRGTPDGSRPGQVQVDTYDPTRYLMLEDEATAYHEGIPGHHLQGSLANELPLHPFHRAVGSSAYNEGWALYVEQLGKELGFYQEPASDLGRLQSQMFRACRLVVDTGVHYKHWTRDQMKAFFLEHYGSPQDAEVDRYIVWPAQALGYKLGQLEILDLRAAAQKELSAKFDIRAFHDEVLSAGPVPLDILDARVRKWIDAIKASSAAR